MTKMYYNQNLIKTILLLAIISIVWSKFSNNNSAEIIDHDKFKEKLIEDEKWIKVHGWDEWLETECLFDDQQFVETSQDTPSPDFLFSPSEFESLDLSPFLESFKNGKRMPIFKFKNSRNIILCLTLAIISGIFFLLVLTPF